MNVEEAILGLRGRELPEGAPFDVTARDVILYALSVGAAREPVFANKELSYVYEHSPDFQVLPTFACTFGFLGSPQGQDPLFSLLLSVAGPKFNPAALVHGEQDLQLHAPLRPGMRLRNRARIADAQDKGSGILLVMESVSVDAAGAAVATNRMSAFIRRLNGRAGGSAAGGARKIAAQGGPPSGGGTSFSGRGAPQQTQQSLLVPAAALGPLRPPGVPSPLFPKGALLLYERVEPSQAMLHRLSGDYNPLHVDPAVAAKGGFPAPILHGLCTLGISVRAIVSALLDRDCGAVAGVRCRFSGVVFPGETLIVAAWREGGGDSKISFSTVVADRGNAPAIMGGEIRLVGLAGRGGGGGRVQQLLEGSTGAQSSRL